MSCDTKQLKFKCLFLSFMVYLNYYIHKAQTTKTNWFVFCVSGRMYLFYGNKTSVQFASFSTTVSCPGELQSHILDISLCFQTGEVLALRMNTISYCHWRVTLNTQLVLNNQPQLNVQTKPVEPLVEGGAQIQQVLNIECLTDFSDAPLLNIKFR